MELITIDEVMEQLGIGRSLAYKLVKSGALNAFKIGSVWKIPQEAVDQFLRQKAFGQNRDSVSSKL